MFMYTTGIRTILVREEMRSAERPTGTYGCTASTALTDREEAGYPTTRCTCTIRVQTVASITGMQLQGTSQNVARSPVATILQEEGIRMGLTAEVLEIRDQIQETTLLTTAVPPEDLILVLGAGTNEMTGWKGRSLAGTLRTLQHALKDVLKTEAT